MAGLKHPAGADGPHYDVEVLAWLGSNQVVTPLSLPVWL